MFTDHIQPVSEDRGRIFFTTITLSCIIHVLAVAALVFMPGQVSSRPVAPQAISVSLISLPPGPEPPGPPAAQTEETATSEPALVTAENTEVTADGPEEPLLPKEEPEPAPQESEETPPPAPETAEKVYLEDAPEKETPEAETQEQIKQEPAPEPKPVRVIRRNPKAVKPKKRKQNVSSEAAPKDSIKDAINQIRRKIDSRVAKSGGTGSGSGRRGGGGMSGGINDIYKAQLSYQIEKNWAFNTNLAGGRTDLRVVLMIRILPTGHIQEAWFEQRSGNRYLDDSAYRAVIKSNPLPPLPSGTSEYTVGLVFTPTGLN